MADTQYLGLVRHILANGVEKGDRTGTGTLSTFGFQMRFNLAEGFPLLTTKRLHWPSIAHELLWFIRGDTNTKYLTDNGVKIWNDWRRPYKLDRQLQFIETLKASHEPYFGDFSARGINASKGTTNEKLANTWVRMMRRCYDPNNHRYPGYGAQGTSVAKVWHDPRKFIDDVKKLPHWFYKEKDWKTFELDKDYFGANQYGPNTSVWLHTAENNFYTKNVKPIKVTSELGVSEVFVSLNDAARSINMSASTLSRFINQGTPKILKGKNKAYIGWEFEVANLNGKLPRLKLIEDGDLGAIYGKQWVDWGGINQIAQVIEQIRNNPDSRRLLVNAWNVGELDQMALPPCHFAFQFYVANGRLSCQLYQRSGDVFLGVPFNIASYSLLTHMIAHVTGLEVGEFIHTIGDAHIYTNHIEQVQTQLAREPRALPQLVIKREVTDIDDFRFEDFEIVGYDPHPKITGKVAV